ncbi:MAG: DUF748 domain-containing protein, partial [Pseudomonadales bacterium]|nr:DUF748 domain-containing protein [Pseudomonadales bacterium]
QQGKLNLDALLKEPTHEEDIASGRASAVEEPVTIAAGPSSVERDFQVIVDSFQIKNGRVSVFDKTVSPPFRLQLKQLQASMSGSNEVLSAGLEGQLNDAAPLALKMEVTDLMKEKNGSVDFSIHHFDMGSLGVYSGRYLGWGIDRGQLNYDMNMQKNVSLLKGKNLLLLDQFQWGKKVESDQQIDVPVKTATALFRGVDGKIVIDVPLEGDISGPDFKLGKFITGAFANLFVKSLASPFTLLASVVNSEEDLASIAFQPGSHAVDESAAMKLHQVAVALEQRPSLNLLVQGAYTAADDLRALKELALARQMQEAGLSKAALLARNEEWQALVAVDCDQLYRKNPERYAACSSDDLDQQFSLVLQAQEVTGEQLQALAGNRALAVKNYLLENEAVPADRVFVKGDVVNDFQGVNLQINF